MLQRFGLPFRTHMVGLYTGTMAADLADLAPARTVPVMRTPEGHVLTDSLAIAETLAERHPEAGLWPTDPAARALARCLVAEMHAGFGALRSDCPNNIGHVWQEFAPSDAVRRDIARVEDLWSLARMRHGRADTPWLFGDYSLADVFYAPVACRFTTYDLTQTPEAAAYVDAHLSDPAFIEWRIDALTETRAVEPYRFDLPRGEWPVNHS